MADPVETGDDEEPKVERRRNWSSFSWLWGGLFGLSVGISSAALNVWSNDSVQNANINYLTKQVEEIKLENRTLRAELGAQKLNQENFTGEVLDLMRRLTEQDRFRKQR